MATFDAMISEAESFRHELHQHPELTWQEHETARRIRDRLSAHGMTWRDCARTGTVVDLAADKSGPAIALRADCDALPILERTDLPYASANDGVMHACGHDGHSASLFAAALWLKAHEADLPQPVRLLWQPAEEGGFGAERMIEDGVLDGVGRIYGYHNWPGLRHGTAACPDGPIMAANGMFDIVIEGDGGHAAQPESTHDPLVLAATWVVTAQQIVSRRTAPQDAAVLTVTEFHAGTASNVIADRVHLTGTIRAATSAQRQRIADLAGRSLQNTVGLVGAHAIWRFTPQYDATINHHEPAARAREAIQAELGAGCFDHAGIPLMGAEDFSYYLQQVPGAFMLLGTGPDAPPCHSSRFNFDDRLIPLVARLWARLTGAPTPPA